MAKARIHTAYKKADGARVPSVTTILGVLAKQALLDWAWRCGCDGLDYKVVRDQAGDIGTLAHAMVVAHLKGETADTSEYSPEMVSQAENAVLSFYTWLDQQTVEPILIEEQLVSEAHGYGGTLDLYARINGKAVLVDFKTSKAIYSEHVTQVSAYAQMLMENGHDVDGAFILRIGKEENTSFETRLISQAELLKHFDLFRHCIEVHRLQKELK